MARGMKTEYAILSGGFVSPAAWRCMGKIGEARNAECAECPYCGKESADFNHVAWECRRSGRPTDCKPANELQKRMGWPTGAPGRAEVDRSIIDWLVKVREDVLQHRRAHGSPLTSVENAQDGGDSDDDSSNSEEDLPDVSTPAYSQSTLVSGGHLGQAMDRLRLTRANYPHALDAIMD